MTKRDYTKRSIEIANMIIKHKYTIREIAKLYNIDNFTIHNSIHNVVSKVDPALYNQVKEVFKSNKRIAASFARIEKQKQEKCINRIMRAIGA